MPKVLLFILLQFIRALRASCRYEVHGAENLPRNAADEPGNFVMALWHQNLLAALLTESGRHQLVTMISRSRDGDSIAHVVEYFGHLPARGSSRRDERDKGGKAARDELVEWLQQGQPGAITVDGPLGPPFEVKYGVLDMARKAEVVVIPYYVVASRYWSFPSWDRIRLPQPFSTVRCYYGAAITVPAATSNDEFPALQQRIKQELDRMEVELNPRNRANLGSDSG